ncbi:MAG: ATP-grasp domain-containing protein [Blastococcus sp.]
MFEEPDLVRNRDLVRLAADFPCVAEIVPVPYLQCADVVDAGRSLRDRWRVEAVLPGLEYAVPAAAALASELGLPGATPDAAAVLRDKLRLREVTAAAGIINPEWAEIAAPDDIVEFAQGGPVVVKPANRQASLGVQVFDRMDRRTAGIAWQTVTSVHEPVLLPDRPLQWRYLVEERLNGQEFSAEALVRDGSLVFANVTRKAVLDGRHPVELGHVLPAPLTATEEGRFTDVMQALVSAIGFATGVLHAEWIATDRGLALVECAGRCPGDRIVDLVELAYGLRLDLALIELLAGRFPAMPATASRAAAIRFLTAPPGRVTRIDGLPDLARAVVPPEEAHVDVSVGDEVSPVRSSWDRLGHVVAVGPDGTEAWARAEHLAGCVRVVTEGDDSDGACGAPVGRGLAGEALPLSV